MNLFTNIGGELKELTSLKTNVGGELKELTSLKTNVGGELKEIYTMLPKNITGTHHLTSGVSYRKFRGNESNFNGYTKFLNVDFTKTFVLGTLKFPKNRRIKVKITITITDGYLYKKISSNKERRHLVAVLIGRQVGFDYQSEICAGSIYENETKTTYTYEQTFYSDGSYTVILNRWVGDVTYNSDDIEIACVDYDNDKLSFDYSIEFELV